MRAMDNDHRQGLPRKPEHREARLTRSLDPARAPGGEVHETSRPPLRALVLDYGGVLSLDQDRPTLARMAARTGTEAAAFERMYWKHRHLYDGGCSSEEYWQVMLEELRGHGPTPQELADLDPADIDSWAHYRPEMWNLAAEYRRRGGRTAFLSNNIPRLMARIRADYPLEAWFDVIVASCDEGVTKPEPRIFEICLERLGLPARECLFVDNSAPNIATAQTLGFQTMLFTGTDEDMQSLRRRVLAVQA